MCACKFVSARRCACEKTLLLNCCLVFRTRQKRCWCNKIFFSWLPPSLWSLFVKTSFDEFRYFTSQPSAVCASLIVSPQGFRATHISKRPTMRASFLCARMCVLLSRISFLLLLLSPSFFVSLSSLSLSLSVGFWRRRCKWALCWRCRRRVCLSLFATV